MCDCFLGGVFLFVRRGLVGGWWFGDRPIWLAVGLVVAQELEEVVGGCDELPFGVAGGEAAAHEALGASDGLGVREHGLDDLLSSAARMICSGLATTWAL